MIGMRLAIMQPYFFPYLGHFSLIAASDAWVTFDTSQYTPKGYMNRNRIRGPDGTLRWATVKLARSSIHMQTREARLSDPEAACRSMLGHLSHHRRAPFYSEVQGVVWAAFAGSPASLVQLNVQALRAVCGYVGLPFRPLVWSEQGLPLPEGLGAGEWAPAICEALGAGGYVNPEGGRVLFDSGKFERGGVALQFCRARPFRTRAGEPPPSILDTLLWHSPETVLAAILDYELLPAGPTGESSGWAGQASTGTGAGTETAQSERRTMEPSGSLRTG